MRKLILAAATLALLPQLAFALSLDEAKAKGLVGERQDGYLGVVSSDAEATALVKSINNQRRAEYDRIAGSNGQPRGTIEKLAAEKAYANTRSGQYVQGSDGGWVKK